MKLKHVTAQERAEKWEQKQPYHRKWFAWYPVYIDGHYYWLCFVYRYRICDYTIGRGHHKGYLYEVNTSVRDSWVNMRHKAWTEEEL